MAKLFDKMMDVMGFGNGEEDFEEEVEEIEEKAEIPQIRNYHTRNNSKIVNIHTNVQMEVVITNPEKYEEAQEICDHIKAKKPVVINLENLDRLVAQRVMDFLSGACYALNGDVQRVANNIFIIAPENVDIANSFKEELKTKGIILPWMSTAK
ncbi:cell division protein SepF [Defluviitalea saccharophila]|uniref:Cell division protein SepF n=1 Tax=Defluviitalea saccharophila TaxID=879970 RepID=A0ABZ2Y8P8_9FIRM|nr:cell division protein SepF [Candidatus Epulonipiscium sp.]